MISLTAGSVFLLETNCPNLLFQGEVISWKPATIGTGFSQLRCSVIRSGQSPWTLSYHLCSTWEAGGGGTRIVGTTLYICVNLSKLTYCQNQFVEEYRVYIIDPAYIFSDNCFTLQLHYALVLSGIVWLR